MTERERFVDAYMKREDTVAELSRRFGISRKTGYKWVARYMAGTELTDPLAEAASKPQCRGSRHGGFHRVGAEAPHQVGAGEASGSVDPDQSRRGVPVGRHVRAVSSRGTGW